MNNLFTQPANIVSEPSSSRTRTKLATVLLSLIVILTALYPGSAAQAHEGPESGVVGPHVLGMVTCLPVTSTILIEGPTVNANPGNLFSGSGDFIVGDRAQMVGYLPFLWASTDLTNWQNVSSYSSYQTATAITSTPTTLPYTSFTVTPGYYYMVSMYIAWFNESGTVEGWTYEWTTTYFQHDGYYSACSI